MTAPWSHDMSRPDARPYRSHRWFVGTIYYGPDALAEIRQPEEEDHERFRKRIDRLVAAANAEEEVPNYWASVALETTQEECA